MAWLDTFPLRSVIGGRIIPHPEGGYSLVIEPQTSGTGSGGMIFRGEWTVDSIANAQDVYVIATGDTAGSYVCVVDGTDNTYPPDVNNGHWVSLGIGNTIGEWL